MFLCKVAPPAPVYPADLEKLGFELRDGAFVKKGSSPPESFNFFHTDDEQTNERRKEAIHEAARTEVASELETHHDIKQVYINGASEIKTNKPSEAHVTLLATEVSKLRTKSDVIIVVGEAAAGKQDAGIWAYRILMNNGGIKQGSVLGLVEMVKEQSKQARARQDISRGGYEEELAASTEQLGITDDDDGIPGMILLNPGQLLYSHNENKSMSQVTWAARQRDSALDWPYEISDKYNRVQGHLTPPDHIAAAFNDIIPRLVDPQSRLYIITIGDSAEHTIDTLDTIWLEKVSEGITQQINAVVMADPQNVIPGEVNSLFFQSFLSASGITWKQSTEVPYGQRIDLSLVGDGEINARQTNLEEELKQLERAENPITITNVDGASTDSNAAINGDDDLENGAQQDDEDVLCPTYSAGDCDAITETVLPKVLPEVVRYITSKMNTARRYELMNGPTSQLQFY